MGIGPAEHELLAVTLLDAGIIAVVDILVQRADQGDFLLAQLGKFLCWDQGQLLGGAA